jgi:hypothetical protein
MQRYTIRLFLRNALHIWGGSSDHHQELKNYTYSIWYLLSRYCYLSLSGRSSNSAIVLIHLLFLHQTGSNNPRGLNKNTDKIPFHPYFTVQDILGFAVTIIILTVLALKEPYILKDGSWDFQLLHGSSDLTNTRCCMDSFWAPDDGRRNRLKHVEEYNKLIIKQEFVH